MRSATPGSEADRVPPSVMAAAASYDTLPRLAELRSAAIQKRELGLEAAADALFREALELVLSQPNDGDDPAGRPARLERLHTAAELALHCGETALGRDLTVQACELDASVSGSECWNILRDPKRWPDAWLVAAVRREPPDVASLDTLVDRHWKNLFGRCRLLTQSDDRAEDLAQQTWLRVLRARHTLNPGGNFPGFLATVATNLWRDQRRSATRAGTLADHRMASLDAPIATSTGTPIDLVEALHDPASVRSRDNALLRIDLDRALAQLPPHLLDAVVSRHVAGESCASIAARYHRTEQSVSGWIRQAIDALQQSLSEAPRSAGDTRT